LKIVARYQIRDSNVGIVGDESKSHIASEKILVVSNPRLEVFWSDTLHHLIISMRERVNSAFNEATAGGSR